MTPGYPEHWSHNDVIRAGIVSEKHASIRKMRDLGDTNTSKIRSSLRITDDFMVYVMNSSGDAIGILGNCSLGDLSVTSTSGNKTLPSLILSNGAGSLESINISSQSLLVIENLSRNDVIILRGNISSYTSLTGAQVGMALDDEAKRGITFIVIGDPGYGMLGFSTAIINSTVLDVVNTSQELGLTAGDVVNISDSPIDIPGAIISPNVTDIRIIATAGSAPGIVPVVASWIYEDSRVWYFAVDNGTIDAGLFSDNIARMINSTTTVNWPVCSAPVISSGILQVAHSDAVIAYHDQLLTIRTVVWREQ
jgi:hypothetical protein